MKEHIVITIHGRSDVGKEDVAKVITDALKNAYGESVEILVPILNVSPHYNTSINIPRPVAGKTIFHINLFNT